MDELKGLGWVILYIFVLAVVPSAVVLAAGFFAGLGFFIRDVKYDIKKAISKKKPAYKDETFF